MTDPQKSLFESVYMQYRAMVLQLCRGFMKGDQELANDLTQDVFINIWNSLVAYRGEASYKTWIYRITVNTCLQYFRKEKHRAKILIEEAIRQQADEPNQTVHDNEQRLYKAIGHLEKIDRLIIMMVLEELEYDEIAKIVGVSAINLRVKIHRIKQRIKTILNHEYKDQ